MANIRLCSIPEIDSTYENILDLPTQTAINNFITSRTRYTLPNINIKYDGSIKMIDVPKDYDTMHSVDYVEIYNNGWYTYYFIDSYEILAPEITRCYLTLDVWMTYQTEIEFKTSYVDRCHVDRWDSNGNPTKELVPETITSGEYIVEYDTDGSSTVSTNNGTYIYITSSPIGLIDKDPEGGNKPKPEPTPTETCPGDPANGYVCSNGFRFIKGFEGYASNAYQDSGGVWTIGYGTTEIYDKSNYDALYALQPASEEVCANVFWNSLHDGYGIPLRNQLESDGILSNITTWQFNALASFVYNAGLGSLIRSDMYSYIKSGDYNTAAELWKNTNVHDSAGNLLQGLIARRQAESNIFLNAVYEFRPITNISDGTVVEGDGWIPAESGIVGHDCKGSTPTPTDWTTDIEDELGNKYELPVGGRLSNVYPNYADGTYHGAIDIAGNDAQPIYAPKNNMTVVKVVGGYPNVRNDAIGYGNYVVLEDNDTGIRSWYGHMRTTPSVNVNDSVGVNTILGYVGTSGYSTGPHLHFELRTSPYNASNRINPIKYIYNSDGTKHEPSIGENITRGQGVKS